MEPGQVGNVSRDICRILMCHVVCMYLGLV